MGQANFCLHVFKLGRVKSSGNGFFPTVEGDNDSAYAADDDGNGDAVNVSSQFPSLSTDRSRGDDRVLALSDRNMRNVRHRLG